MAEGTEVTCRDIETGESETQIIKDNYLVVTDGDCYVAHVTSYANGTAIITIKVQPARPS